MRAQGFYLTIIVFALTVSSSCENSSSPPSIDYTGQIDTIFDIDGNTYKTVGIGSQIWIAQNLKTTKLNDGTIIPKVKDNREWRFDNDPAYCWYNNDSARFSKLYGPLYNFHSVSTGLLCPIGWHVPNKSEWETLAKFLGGSDFAGGKLKDYYGSYWNDNHCFANNYGFAALPGGYRFNFTGKFEDIKNIGCWWTSTWGDDNYAYRGLMQHDNTSLDISECYKNDGCSVRCIKD